MRLVSLGTGSKNFIIKGKVKLLNFKILKNWIELEHTKILKIEALRHMCLHSIHRVALIRTLALNPDIILLDEPFSALDYQTRLAVSDDVYKIIKQERKTVLMITHDIAEAISMSDRIVILSSRPACIKKIIDVNLTGKSTPIENRKCIEFSNYYNEIWKELDFHVQ